MFKKLFDRSLSNCEVVLNYITQTITALEEVVLVSLWHFTVKLAQLPGQQCPREVHPPRSLLRLLHSLSIQMETKA